MHPVVTFGQNLERVPVRCPHDFANPGDVLGRHRLVEEIAHRIDEYPLWRAPFQRGFQLFGNEPEVEAEFERMPGHSAKSLGKPFGITMLATGADLRATADRIPGSVGPLDFASITHLRGALLANVWRTAKGGK